MRRHQALHALARRDDADVPACSGWGSVSSDRDLRIASIFIILVGSMLGVFLPMALARTSPNWRYSKLAFFVCKYFGSGVILATAFMHLLSPAVEALSDECLSNMLPSYDWGHAICLMTIMVMFFIELMAARFNFSFGDAAAGHGHGHGQSHGHGSAKPAPAALFAPDSRPSRNSALSGLQASTDVESASASAHLSIDDTAKEAAAGAVPAASEPGLLEANLPPHHHSGGLPSHNLNYPPGNEDHLAHGRDHVPGDSHASYGSQVLSLLILEFGVVFHSLFIGLSLAGAGDTLRVLLIVIAFHQFFEGLGLGSRLAVATWPSTWAAWTGTVMAAGYGVTTPLGIAIGLGVNASLNARPALAQLVNGCFDAVSAGILVYTALVELLAHEFMFNPEMRDAKLSVQMLAFGCVAVGVAVMAVLAKWA